MPRNSRKESFRSNTAGIFATCSMLVLAGLFTYAFLYGADMGAPEPAIIAGETDVTPEEPRTPMPEPEDDSYNTVVIRRPSSLDRLNEAERTVATAVYHIGIRPNSSGSGFMVAPNTLATAAHVVPETVSEATVLVYCIERDDGLLGAATGRTIAIDRELDVALVDIEGCPDVEPVTLSESEISPNDTLHALGYSRGAGFNVLDSDHHARSYIPGADFAEGFRRRGLTADPWITMISPNLLGVTGVFECGNSGGAVFMAGSGEVVGLICGRDPVLIRSFIAPASSIREMLNRTGR